MTANQIAYWTLQETIRSNQVREAQNSESIQEVERSNRAREALTQFSNVSNAIIGGVNAASNLVNSQARVASLLIGG